MGARCGRDGGVRDQSKHFGGVMMPRNLVERLVRRRPRRAGPGHGSRPSSGSRRGSGSIAITLLVLDLCVPLEVEPGGLGHALARAGPTTPATTHATVARFGAGNVVYPALVGLSFVSVQPRQAP
jgi:hypothetical protein